jgi:hypothetical protein
MPFYRDYVYPHIVKELGDPGPIRNVRERIIPLAEGTVLEIGVGPGSVAMFVGPFFGARFAIRLGNLWLRRIFLAAVWVLGLKALVFDVFAKSSGCDETPSPAAH